MDSLIKTFGDNLKQNVSLKDITTVGIGGPATYFLETQNLDELKQAISLSKQNDIKYFLMGSGSNLLFSDSPFDGLIIKNSGVGITFEDNKLIVKAGTLLQDLVNFTIEKGLSGTQKLTGIPGTVGGAIFGNAGAYGQTISDFITSVTGFDGTNEIILSKDQCGFSYRDSKFKTNNLIILNAEFSFPAGDPKQLEHEASEILTKRLAKYPPSVKCPGSFFKNLIVENLSEDILAKLPDKKDTYGKIAAGALLEEVGAKGEREGNIQIASYHGNLFLNLGDGKASDFWNLAKKYHYKVLEKFGVNLEPEVQLINLPPFS